jgi:hypothetical protein
MARQTSPHRRITLRDDVRNIAQRRSSRFRCPVPRKIIPLHLDEPRRDDLQDSFPAGPRSPVSIAFQKKIGVALFGGEGFIMQRLQGDGIVLVHAGGTLCEKTLAPGETLKLDTGCLVALQPSVNYDIQMVGGFKNTIFGGEGLFLATLTGPGKVWLQSLPFSRLAGRMMAGAAKGKDEGSSSTPGRLGMVMGIGGAFYRPAQKIGPLFALHHFLVNLPILPPSPNRNFCGA